MDALMCPKCKNDNFEEVVDLTTECKRVVPNIHLDSTGKRVASGEAEEVCEAPSESVSYVCNRCKNTYVLQGGQLVPTWL